MSRKALGPFHWPVPQVDQIDLDQSHFHALIIGAGIGGLTAAALLAKRGYKVLLVEQHNIVGGNCSSWKRHIKDQGIHKVFTFDSGVQDISGLGVQGPLRNLLAQLGIEGEIDWKRVEHSYWHNGSLIYGGENTETFIKNLSERFPTETSPIQTFFDEMKLIYQDMYADSHKTGGIPLPPSTTSDIITWPENHPYAAKWMNASYNEILNYFFNDNDLKHILTTLAEYITDKPDDLTVMDMAPLFGYYFDGGHFPKGGVQKLPNLLAKTIKAYGGEIILKTRTKKVLTKDNKVTGILTDKDQSFYAPIVLSNADIVRTITDYVEPALPSSPYKDKITTMKRGPTAILMSIGLSVIPTLPARVFIEANGLAFGIGNPSAVDDSLAPKNHAPLSVLYLLPEEKAAQWDKDSKDYQVKKEEIADKLISAIEQTIIPDIRDHIIYKEIATPATFTSYTGSVNGNIYGAARNQWRPTIKSPIEGLFLIGAATKIGAGIEAVVISGTQAADVITSSEA